MKRILMTTAATALLAAGPALAEWNPDGPIRLWIGYGAGGGTDVQGRTLAKEIEAKRGWQVTVSYTHLTPPTNRESDVGTG